MLEVTRLLAVLEHAHWLGHVAPVPGEVESSQPDRDFFSDDDSGNKQVSNGPLPELTVRIADDSKHTVLVLKLVEVEEVGQRLILVVASDRAESRSLDDVVLSAIDQAGSLVDNVPDESLRTRAFLSIER